jgi:hypothetical protein
MHIVRTHAGDDSDGRIWGVEGANILFLLAALCLPQMQQMSERAVFI